MALKSDPPTPVFDAPYPQECLRRQWKAVDRLVFIGHQMIIDGAHFTEYEGKKDAQIPEG